MSTDGDPTLIAVLERARELGFLGPGPVEPHVRHALGFAAAATSPRDGDPERFLDLGSGGGIPGLVLASVWPAASGVLLDGMARRCRPLRAWVDELGWSDRIQVVEGRAEVVGHDPGYREHFDVVTARSFGSPAVTAENGTPFVRVGGVLVVSEPPGGGSARWPTEALSRLACGRAALVQAVGATYARIPKSGRSPEEYPRRTGVPAKRPLW